MDLTVFTDGGSSGNPGPCASAYVIYQNAKLLFKYGKNIGHGTNNLAEYTALIMALGKIRELIDGGEFSPVQKIYIFADSLLMINQVNGFYKVKNPVIKDLMIKVRLLEAEINVPIVYRHILREKNALADSLVKKALGIF